MRSLPLLILGNPNAKWSPALEKSHSPPNKATTTPMAAASPSPTFLSLDLLSSFHRLSSPLPFPSSSSSSSSSHNKPRHHLLLSIKSSSTHSPPTTTTTTTTTFSDPISLHRLRTLDAFHLSHQLPHGSLRIRPMAPHELDPAVSLLAESFAESMWIPATYVKVLEFLVKQYVVERRNLEPHSVMLVGFYEDKGEDGETEGGGGAQLACTAEVSFDARGANAAPPTPLPPRNCPYICNMTVKKAFRRRGIGRQLLTACEELISQMKTIRKVYLHCRVIDTVPFQMYNKAGYKIVKQDSILIWLSLQRRKYLMCKELPPLVEPQSDNSDSEDDPF